MHISSHLLDECISHVRIPMHMQITTGKSYPLLFIYLVIQNISVINFSLYGDVIMLELHCRTILQIVGVWKPIWHDINILQYCFQTKQGNIRDIFLCLTLTFVTNISICSIPSSINPLRDFLFDINCCKVLLNSRKCNFGK